MTVMDRACGWRFENDAGSQIAPKFKKKKNTPKNYERKTAKMTETEKNLWMVLDVSRRALMGTAEDNRSAAGKEEAPRRRFMAGTRELHGVIGANRKKG